MTNAPDAVDEFIRLYAGEVVFKSVSSTRSVVRKVGPADLARLGDVRACPTQFQQRVGGVDVRVHVVGHEVFATRIESSADDYRYGSRDGVEAQLSVETLDAGIAERCRLLAGELGLPFAGIDLRVDQDDVWCLEVNPAPAFSYYEAHTGQPIARAVARLLVSGEGRARRPLAVVAGLSVSSQWSPLGTYRSAIKQWLSDARHVLNRVRMSCWFRGQTRAPAPPAIPKSSGPVLAGDADDRVRADRAQCHAAVLAGELELDQA